MIIYLDENIPRAIALALNKAQQPLNKKFTGLPDNTEVRWLPDDFGKGAKDEDWIPGLGNKDIIITNDQRINILKHQWQLCKDHKLRMFFFRFPDGYKYWDRCLMLFNKWETVLECIIKNKNAFAFRITKRGKPQDLDL